MNDETIKIGSSSDVDGDDIVVDIYYRICELLWIFNLCFPLMPVVLRHSHSICS